METILFALPPSGRLSIDLRKTLFQIPIHLELGPDIQCILMGLAYLIKAPFCGHKTAPQVLYQVFTVVSPWLIRWYLSPILCGWLAVMTNGFHLSWSIGMFLHFSLELRIFMYWEVRTGAESLVSVLRNWQIPSRTGSSHHTPGSPISSFSVRLIPVTVSKAVGHLWGHVASLECYKIYPLHWTSADDKISMPVPSVGEAKHQLAVKEVICWVECLFSNVPPIFFLLQHNSDWLWSTSVGFCDSDSGWVWLGTPISSLEMRAVLLDFWPSRKAHRPHTLSLGLCFIDCALWQNGGNGILITMSDDSRSWYGRRPCSGTFYQVRIEKDEHSGWEVQQPWLSGMFYLKSLGHCFLFDKLMWCACSLLDSMTVFQSKCLWRRFP